jgi:hypothetical protein
LLLVLYFISSNAATCELQNIYLRMLLETAQIKMPALNSFNDSILPMVYDQLIKHINFKLREAYGICLIVDIWSSSQMVDLLGLAATIMYKNFEFECLVIGLDRMIGSHNAENIKIAIVKIINRFDFDKKKIIGTLRYKFKKN